MNKQAAKKLDLMADAVCEWAQTRPKQLRADSPLAEVCCRYLAKTNSVQTPETTRGLIARVESRRLDLRAIYNAPQVKRSAPKPIAPKPQPVCEWRELTNRLAAVVDAMPAPRAERSLYGEDLAIEEVADELRIFLGLAEDQRIPREHAGNLISLWSAHQNHRCVHRVSRLAREVSQ